MTDTKPNIQRVRFLDREGFLAGMATRDIGDWPKVGESSAFLPLDLDGKTYRYEGFQDGEAIYREA